MGDCTKEKKNSITLFFKKNWKTFPLFFLLLFPVIYYISLFINSPESANITLKTESTNKIEARLSRKFNDVLTHINSIKEITLSGINKLKTDYIKDGGFSVNKITIRPDNNEKKVNTLLLKFDRNANMNTTVVFSVEDNKLKMTLSEFNMKFCIYAHDLLKIYLNGNENPIPYWDNEIAFYTSDQGKKSESRVKIDFIMDLDMNETKNNFPAFKIDRIGLYEYNNSYFQSYLGKTNVTFFPGSRQKKEYGPDELGVAPLLTANLIDGTIESLSIIDDQYLQFTLNGDVNSFYCQRNDKLEDLMPNLFDYIFASTDIFFFLNCISVFVAFIVKFFSMFLNYDKLFDMTLSKKKE